MRKKSILYVLALALLAGCSGQQPPFESEEDWKLAWRVWESVNLEQDFLTGANLFDSLIKKKKDPAVQIMLAGIQCLAETSQYTKAYDVLQGYPHLAALDLCKNRWFKPPPTLEWGAVCNQMISEKEVSLPEIRDNLVLMYINDQYARGTELRVLLNETGYPFKKGDLYRVSQPKTDEINTEKLKIIIDELGFPDEDMVGRLGMKCVMTIIGNSNDTEFQESQLSNLYKSAQKGEILLEDYAYVVDQVEINKGNSQKFGTHFSIDDLMDGKATLVPATNEEVANQNRMELGLMPLETFKRWRLFPFERLLESQS